MCHASHAQNADDPERAHDLVEVMQICHCLDKSNEIGGLLDERRDRREYFLNWLWQRVIAPRILVDSSFLERIGDYLEQFYSALLADYRGNTSGKERQILKLSYADELFDCQTQSQMSSLGEMPLHILAS